MSAENPGYTPPSSYDEPAAPPPPEPTLPDETSAPPSQYTSTPPEKPPGNLTTSNLKDIEQTLRNLVSEVIVPHLNLFKEKYQETVDELRKVQQQAEAKLRDEKVKFETAKRKFAQDSANLESRQTKLDQEEQALAEEAKKLQAQVEEKETLFRQAKAFKEAGETELEKAETARAQAEKDLEVTKKLSENVRKYFDRLAPELLHPESQLLQQIFAKALEENPGDPAPLLLAHLHLLRHALGDGCELYLKDTLRETGRLLIAFLKTHQLPPEQANRWADLLNQRLSQDERNLTIRLPEIGAPLASSWMAFRKGGDSVKEVITWALVNERDIAVLKAEVLS